MVRCWTGTFANAVCGKTRICGAPFRAAPRPGNEPGAALVMRLIVGLAALATTAAATFTAAPATRLRTGIADDVIGAAVLIAAATPAAAVEVPIDVEVAVDVLILILISIDI